MFLFFLFYIERLQTCALKLSDQKSSTPKDVSINQNKRLTAENAWLRKENGKNKIFFSENYLLDLHMFCFFFQILYRSLEKRWY